MHQYQLTIGLSHDRDNNPISEEAQKAALGSTIDAIIELAGGVTFWHSRGAYRYKNGELGHEESVIIQFCVPNTIGNRQIFTVASKIAAWHIQECILLTHPNGLAEFVKPTTHNDEN